MNAGRRGRRIRERTAQPESPAQRLYLESSTLLAGLLEDDIKAIRAIHPPVTTLSVLTLAEARRAVQRAVAGNRIGADKRDAALATIDQLERDCTVLEITDTILARVGRRFPVEPVRTLDAIHLATAELIDEPAAPVTLLTRDHRIRENAVLLGLQVA